MSEENMKTSMLRKASNKTRAASSIVAMLASVSAGTLMAQPQRPTEPVYNVISPIGETTVKLIDMAPRLDTLAGKTVCMVSNSAFKVNITMPAIAKALQAKYPTLKIVPYTEMATAYSGADYEAKAGEYKGKGCNAVITGNGG
jgi:hypothetical protein